MVLFPVMLIILLLAIGLRAGMGQPSFRRFVIADHNRSWPIVLCSLLATMIGGSATFGITATAYDIGFPAFWWLGVGSLGLVFQAFFLSAKVRELEARTLAEAAEKLVDKKAGTAVSVVVSLSWPGIIAGQFIALGDILSLFTGQKEATLFIIIAALVVIAFTAMGGQLAVMRTDSIFFFLIAAGVIAAFGFLFFGTEEGASIGSQIELFNEEFSVSDLIGLLFIVGGTYFIGPDVLSRSMTAKDGRHAKIASLLGAAALMLFNILIVSVAMWCKVNVDDIGGLHPLVYMMHFRFPVAVTQILALSLTAALLSSASTCLITVAATVQRDLLQRESTGGTRLLIGIIGIFSLALALRSSDIIAVLTAAYAVYAPGIAAPLFIAFCLYKKQTFDPKKWLAAVICGGTFGILGNFLDLMILPLLGMGLSALLTFFACKKELSQI